MANKSDSAGKLHQYYTTKSLSLRNNNCKIISPLDDISIRQNHKVLFRLADLNALKIVGDLTANCILSKFNKNILMVEDIGVSSGAIGIRNTDDLKIKFDDESFITLSLKCAKNINQILSKNMGAKSLLREYFNASSEQINFNDNFEKDYILFLKKVLNSNQSNIREIKKEINADAINNGLQKARFADERYMHMNSNRDIFLNGISNNLEKILLSLDKSNLANACNIILDTEKHHFIGLYKSGKEKVNYDYIEKIYAKDITGITSRGNDSVVIETTDYLVGFRYKFESGINSSIKLVGDYKKK